MRRKKHNNGPQQVTIWGNNDIFEKKVLKDHLVDFLKDGI